MITLIAAVLLGAGSPDAPARADKVASDERKVCRRHAETGSFVRHTKICRTRAEWKQIEQAARETAGSMQSQLSTERGN